MLGSSYTGAFLSNQIRYGLMTREEAWENLEDSNIGKKTPTLDKIDCLRYEYSVGMSDPTSLSIQVDHPGLGIEINWFTPYARLCAGLLSG